MARERRFRSELAATSYHPVANATDAAMLTEEYGTLAHRAINQLPPQRRLIFTLRRQQDLSHEEIAQQLGISKNTVKVQLVKASKFLREYFATHTDISLVWILSLLSLV